jgi:hypothetical protein
MFAINGWKVARQIPKWVIGFDEFLQFMEDDWNLDDKYEYHPKNDMNDNVEEKSDDEIDDDGVQEEDDDVEAEDLLEEEDESNEIEDYGLDYDEEDNKEKMKPGIEFHDGYMKNRKPLNPISTLSKV